MPEGLRAKRWLARLGLGLLGGLLGLAAGLGLRPAPPDAPTVVLSVGRGWVDDVGLHQAAYQAVLRAQGARVVEVSPDDGRAAAEVLAEADALLLAGGGDVEPARYGGERGRDVDAERDAFEVGLVREALARDLPLLGVCRGIQLLNVVFGGTLQDLREAPALARTHGITARSLAAHAVALEPGSLLHLMGLHLIDEGELRVNSFHGQAVARVGSGLRVAARAPDGVVEAVEVEGARFAIGVQWHPELMTLSDPLAQRLFDRFLEEAQAASARRRPSRYSSAPSPSTNATTSK